MNHSDDLVNQPWSMQACVDMVDEEDLIWTHTNITGWCPGPGNFTYKLRCTAADVFDQNCTYDPFDDEEWDDVVELNVSCEPLLANVTVSLEEIGQD